MAIDPQLKERLRSEKAESLIIDADKAALLIKDGMAVGISGFTHLRSRQKPEEALKSTFTPVLQ